MLILENEVAVFMVSLFGRFHLILDHLLELGFAGLPLTVVILVDWEFSDSSG